MSFFLYSYNEDSVSTKLLYDVIIKSNTNAYRIHDVKLSDYENLKEFATYPNDATDGAIVHLAKKWKWDDDPNQSKPKTEYYIRPIMTEHDVDFSSVGKYYPAKNYGNVEALDMGYIPKFKIVAIDETHSWDDSITEKLGRIKGVYVYNEAKATHICDMTPSYELFFLLNRSELSYYDYMKEENREDDEDYEQEFYKEFGYDYGEESFKQENSGEQYSYSYCHNIDSISAKEGIELTEDWIDDYMFSTEEEREKIEYEMFCDLSTESNGEIMNAFPEGTRSIEDVKKGTGYQA